MGQQKPLGGAGLRGQVAGQTALSTVGQAGAGLTYRGYDVRELAADAQFEEVQCSTMGVFAPVVGVMGTLQAAEALKLIAGFGTPATNRLTMFDSRTNLSLQVAEEVKRHFPGQVYATVIPRNVRLSEAPSHGQSAAAPVRHSPCRWTAPAAPSAPAQ